MEVDGNNSGNFTEVSNMIANMEQNKELFESINSRATFARHLRKHENNLLLSNNNMEKLKDEKVLEKNNQRISSGGSWMIEEIPLNSRQSKNLMESLNETQLHLTITIQDEEDKANIENESVKSNESITILNELYIPKSESDENISSQIDSNKKRTPIQSKKSKFESFIPNSIRNMFLSTKRSQSATSLNEEKQKPAKKTTKIRKSPQTMNQTEDSSSSSSSPVVTTTPNYLDSIDSESILSNWISTFESVESLQKLLNSDKNHSTSTSQNNSFKFSNSELCLMSGKQFYEIIRISYLQNFKTNLVTPLDEKLIYAFVQALIGMELVTIEDSDKENTELSSCKKLDETKNLFESLSLNVYIERFKQQKEKVFYESLQFLSNQVTCQPTLIGQPQTISNHHNNTTQINNSTSNTADDRNNEQYLNTDKNMLLQQRRESTLLLSFEEFLSVNNQKMGSSLSLDEDGNVYHKAEIMEEEESTMNTNQNTSLNDKCQEIKKEDSQITTTTTIDDLNLSNSTATSTLISSLGTNVSNHIKQPSINNHSTTNCNNTSPSSSSSTLPSSNEEIVSSPYELKLKIGDKTLSELKQQLKDRKHRYGFLTPSQFLEFGLRAGFDEEEFASIYAVTYSTLMSAHQLIPQMQHVMKTILNDEKLPKPITDEDDEDEQDDNNRGSILEDDCKLSKEEKNNVIGRVARFLKQFVLLSFSDFQYDKQFHEILYSFVAPLIGFIDFEASNGALIQEQVVDLVERITLVISGAHEDQFCQTELPPKPLIKKLPTDPRKINLIDIDPLEIARQLTLFEFSSFEKLSAKELLGASWMKDSKEWTAPNVTQLIWRSNQLTDWVSTFICSITNLKERKKALKHLIHVADACLEIHNYNTVFEIVMGLISQPVYRLKKTWDVLKENDLQRVWKRLEDITSFPGNRRVYRDQIQKVIKESVTKLTPCLPYLGVHLSDLVFFDEGNKDSMEKGVTTFYNCTKRACMGQIVYQIIAVKKIPYNFQKVDLIEQFIWWQFNSKVLHDEEQRDKLSKKCE